MWQITIMRGRTFYLSICCISPVRTKTPWSQVLCLIQFYIPHRIRGSVWYIVDAHYSYMFKVHWIQINISDLFYMGENLMKSPNSKEVGREIGNIPLCKSTHWPLCQADKWQLGSGRKFLWVYSAFGPEKPMIKHYKWVRIMLVVLTTLPHWSPWLSTCLDLAESPVHKTFLVPSSSPPIAFDVNDPVVLSLSHEMRVHLCSYFISLTWL